MSPLGRRVADLLGQLFAGMYHLQSNITSKPDWSNERCIAVSVPIHNMGTYDFSGLTMLVVLCHDAAIRCELQASAFGYVKLCFSQRQRYGGCTERHPTMEQATAKIREKFAIPELTFNPSKDGE